MKWLIGILLSIVAIIVGISFYLQPNDFIGCSETPLDGTGNCAKADAIVVVSGGDTPARTAEGVRLLQAGWADVIILSGAAQDKTGLSNAAAMQLQAVAAGVSPDAIYVDEYSQNTAENAQNTQLILQRHDLQKVILVTSGYHQQRASLEFNKVLSSNVLNHPLLTDQDWSLWWWTNPRGWWLAGGEIVKIIAFYASGAMR